MDQSLINTRDLLTMDGPPNRWTVQDILPAGLAFLAGRPKQGKSWLALQLALCVGTGGTFLGHRCIHGNVLYLALEDNPRRIQSRLKTMQAPPHAYVDFSFEEVSVECMEGYDLIVVDTLGRAKELKADELQRFALNHGVTVLCVDHHRKNGGKGDAIDDIIGQTVKGAVIDAAMGLYRERGKDTATIKITGRDAAHQEMHVRFDTSRCLWRIAHDSPRTGGSGSKKFKLYPRTS